MAIRERFEKHRVRVEEQGIRLERYFRSRHETLLERFRPYEVVATAVKNFWDRRMYYSTTYFTYNAFLATLALLVALSSVMGFVVNSASAGTKQQILDSIRSIIPIIGGTTKNTLDSFAKYRSVVGAIGLIALIWTGTKLFGALEWGFCEITGSKRRFYVRGKLLGMALVTVIGIIFIITVLVQFGFSALWSWLFTQGGMVLSVTEDVLQVLLTVIVNFALFLFAYKVIPTVKQSWRSCMVGAAISAVLFLGIQYLLSFYFYKISSIPSVYGSVSTVLVLLIWLHLTGMIVYFGEDIVHVMETDGKSEMKGDLEEPEEESVPGEA